MKVYKSIAFASLVIGIVLCIVGFFMNGISELPDETQKLSKYVTIRSFGKARNVSMEMRVDDSCDYLIIRKDDNKLIGMIENVKDNNFTLLNAEQNKGYEDEIIKLIELKKLLFPNVTLTREELLNRYPERKVNVVTRFAPSPTGRMHVGNLRTALYAYLITKHEGGDFILRIEDTDQERYVEGAVDIIYRTLAKTGLLHDEGPDKDKGFGPYVQSERQAQGIYLKYAQQLVEQGDAYYCFCKKEELEGMKRVVAGKEISIYDKRCLKLSKEEVQRRLDAGEPHVIRFNMPTEGTTTFHDVIYGDITVNNEELEDLILIKSDGYPTYNFANVIDDHLMEITHVVRGNEYLSSAPKYNRIYEAFGWDIPVYVHCPLITDETHQKLSKRCGHSSYEDLLDQGFVSEAIINYVALLGWSPSDNREIFTLDELVQVFDYHHINKSPAVFDIAKLRWMNGEYIKKMDADEFYERALPYMKEVLKKDYNFKKIAGMVQTRIETFPDIPALIDFFEEVPEYDSAMYCHKKMKTNEETSLTVLKEVLPVLEEQEDYTNDPLFETLSAFVKEHGYKNGYVMWPLRTAVSGKQMTPAGATEIMEIIGKDETIKRVKAAIEKLSK